RQWRAAIVGFAGLPHKIIRAPAPLLDRPCGGAPSMAQVPGRGPPTRFFDLRLRLRETPILVSFLHFACPPAFVRDTSGPSAGGPRLPEGGLTRNEPADGAFP